ncbi:MAG: class I SAM-dependent methyltransferase [Actinomycetota bacterium]
MLSRHIVTRLRCPNCRSEISDEDGGLRCREGHALPLVDGYIDASGLPPDEASRRTLERFGYEWTTFDCIQPEDHEFWSNYFDDVPPESLVGRIGVDVGCGKGRYAYFTAPLLRALVALDGSSAVTAAAKNLAEFENVVVVRADLRQAPLAGETFDFVYCLGVLHHLPDPREGFRSLVGLLARGGRLLIYVYSRPEHPGMRRMGLAAAALLRRATTRLPPPAVRALSALIAPALYVAFVIPGRVGERLGLPALEQLPLGTYRGRPLRSLWLDTFDRLAAPLERRFVWSEIEPWFADAGLVVERVRENAGLFVLARRPDRTSG